MLEYEFMRRSLLMGIMIGLIAPSVGYFLVLRRQSVIGDTLSHVALSGAALGMLIGVYPIYTAIIFTIIAAFIIEWLRRKYKTYAELSLAIVLALGVGLASVLISLGNTQGIMSYLFGSLSLVTREDLTVVLGLGLVVLGTIFFLYNNLFYITFDEEGASLADISTKIINSFFSVLVAITVAISMRIVGALLISSLMVLPVAASLLIAKSFKSGFVYSVIFGLVSVILGLVLSFYLDLASGGTIVLTALALLLVLLIYSKRSNNQ